MTYKDVLDRILKIDEKIRLVSITDLNGKVTNSGHQVDVRNILTYNESQLLLQLAVKTWKARNPFKHKIGIGEYSIAVYEKLKRITVRLGNAHLAYLTTEREANHDKIVLEILKIVNQEN
ncbi:MAG: hypothetical protein ACE5DL_02415 [Nitrosopumilaceae archaeon]